jgi:hypothetical protein
MKKRFDDGGYVPKSIFNQEGTDVADVGESSPMASSSEETPKEKKKAHSTRAARPKSTETRKDDYSNEGRSSKAPSKLDPYGVVGGAVDKIKGAASDVGDAVAKPFRAIREAGNRGNPDVPMKMAKGGSASSRADGIAQRGKTKGTMVMCGGGMTKR